MNPQPTETERLIFAYNLLCEGLDALPWDVPKEVRCKFVEAKYNVDTVIRQRNTCIGLLRAADEGLARIARAIEHRAAR